MEKLLQDVYDYYGRRRDRLKANSQEARFDSGLGWLFGIATDLGIETKGKPIPKIFEEVNAKRAQKGLAPVGAKGKANGAKSGKQTVKSRSKPQVNNELVAQAKEDAKKNFSNTCTTKSGVKFPKPKEGAKFDMAVMKGMEDLIAKQNGGSKAYDKLVGSLKSSDYVYMKDPTTGDTIASIPGLSQRVDTQMHGRSEECQRIYDDKVRKGQKITQDMIETVNSVGSRLSGLENCYKGANSTSRKIDTKRTADLAKNPPVKKTDEQYVRGFGDVVRFTVMSDHDKIADSVEKMEKAMAQKGYRQTERENKWTDGDGAYKAIHLQFESPDGERFEVQVHSSVALAFKNKGHHYYETSRVQPNEKRKLAGLEKCKSIWMTCPTPKGVERLKSFKK